jgi:hypothetical protein
MGMLPDYPRVKRQIQEKFEEIIRKEIEKDPFLSQIGRHEIHEGNSLTVTSTDGYSRTTQYQDIATDFKIEVDEIIKRGIAAFFSRIPDITKEMIRKQSQLVINVTEEVTERTGNVVSANSEPISPQLILAVLEKMAINFDEFGNPIMPTLIVAPEEFEKTKAALAKLESDPDLRKRQMELFAKKRKEWIDRENNRKLVD